LMPASSSTVPRMTNVGSEMANDSWASIYEFGKLDKDCQEISQRVNSSTLRTSKRQTNPTYSFTDFTRSVSLISATFIRF
jgi:hypothetical protein